MTQFKYKCSCGITHVIEVGELKIQEIKYENEPAKGKVKATVTASTDKAVMLMINGIEAWYPRSTIKEDVPNEGTHELSIKSWILERNGVIK